MNMRYFQEVGQTISVRLTHLSFKRIGTDKYGEELFEIPFGRIFTKTEMMELLTEAMTWILKEEDDE